MKRRRRRGEGSVFYRKGRGWVAQVAYRGPDGRRHFLTRLMRDERSAKLALPGLLARVGLTGEFADPHRTLDTYLADWLERMAGSVAPATHTSYEGHVQGARTACWSSPRHVRTRQEPTLAANH